MKKRAASIVGLCVALAACGAASPHKALPVELVYLDAARVNAYLGQIEGGLTISEHRNVSDAVTGSASITAGGVNLGGSASSTESTELTVTPDVGDRFFELLALETGLQSKGWFTPINVLMHSARIPKVKEGTFIELSHARLVEPNFALPVPALSPAGSPLVSVPRLTTLIATEPKEIQAYLRSFGPNPTVPLTVKSSADTVRVPILLTGLLNQPDLIGGDVSIFGIVARQVTKKDSKYYDPASEVSIERALAKVPRDLATILKLPFCGRDGEKHHDSEKHHDIDRRQDIQRLASCRSEIATQAEKASRVSPTGTVILPIAIYVTRPFS